MRQITSHVLDTSRGKPAEGIEIVLYGMVEGRNQAIARGRTNSDGRVAGLVDEKTILEPSVYTLRFETAAYFRGLELEAFYPFVEISFTITEGSHYHIPLLLSQYGYTTYRGS